MRRMVKSAGMLMAAVLILACGLVQTAGQPVQDVSTIVAGTLQALTPPGGGATQAPPATAAVSQAAGTQVSFAGVSFTVPQGLGSGATCETVPAVSDQSGAPWEVAPAYVRCSLQSYPLQGKFFEPQLMIYPAAEYAAVSPGAAQSIQRLQTILDNPSPSLSNDVLPRLPWANAEQLIGAQPVVLSFGGGSGLRVLAEYAQYSAQINNHELFYHFEGLTANGKSYVVTTLPVNTSYLAAGSDPASPIPPDGIPFPGMDVTDPAAWASYYQAVTNRLSTTTPESFQPSLSALDALMQSLQITP